jgi:hypothetical protein
MAQEEGQPDRLLENIVDKDAEEAASVVGDKYGPDLFFSRPSLR